MFNFKRKKGFIAIEYVVTAAISLGIASVLIVTISGNMKSAASEAAKIDYSDRIAALRGDGDANGGIGTDDSIIDGDKENNGTTDSSNNNGENTNDGNSDNKVPPIEPSVNISSVSNDGTYVIAEVVHENLSKNIRGVFLKFQIRPDGGLTVIDGNNSNDFSNVTQGSFLTNDGLDLPDSVDGMPIVEIGDYSLLDARFIGMLKLPKELKRIGKCAFQYNGFTGDLVLPDGLEIVEEYSFLQSRFDGSITIPESVTFIGNGAFQYSTFKNGKIPATTKVSDWVFQHSTMAK